MNRDARLVREMCTLLDTRLVRARVETLCGDDGRARLETVSEGVAFNAARERALFVVFFNGE